MNIFDRKENLKHKTIIHLSISKSLSVNPLTIELELVFTSSAVVNTPEKYLFSIRKNDVAYYFPAIRDYAISNFSVISTEILYDINQEALYRITYAARNNSNYRYVELRENYIGRIANEYI